MGIDRWSTLQGARSTTAFARPPQAKPSVCRGEKKTLTGRQKSFWMFLGTCFLLPNRPNLFFNVAPGTRYFWPTAICFQKVQRWWLLADAAAMKGFSGLHRFGWALPLLESLACGEAQMQTDDFVCPHFCPTWKRFVQVVEVSHLWKLTETDFGQTSCCI